MLPEIKPLHAIGTIIAGLGILFSLAFFTAVFVKLVLWWLRIFGRG